MKFAEAEYPNLGYQLEKATPEATARIAPATAMSESKLPNPIAWLCTDFDGHYGIGVTA